MTGDETRAHSESWPPAPASPEPEQQPKPKPPAAPKWIALVLSTIALVSAGLTWTLALYRIWEFVTLAHGKRHEIVADDYLFVFPAAIVASVLSFVATILMRQQHRKLRGFARFALGGNLTVMAVYAALYVTGVVGWALPSVYR